ncbi:hypothetical protein J3A84_05305 [Proteiniclasticum sp. SCR006]|uniref:Uncharacterized protein n=1 Tax=Proteiniclasticum aestuarii TaxID=2817862 RepID=A0A939HBV2_9CLOT|nr:hypothetical protein [Proteiniclasticum aestuarii]MBO1264458.1 hypothetical protein [Proteiniclasticum aestuarii]
MSISDFLNNCIESLMEIFRKYSPVIVPVLVLVIIVIINSINSFVNVNQILLHIPSISGTLAGFLFTFFGIFTALPDNNFIKVLKSNGYMKIIHITLITGISTLLVSMVLSIFGVLSYLSISLFIVGVSETMLASFYLFIVSTYSSKSK